MECSPLLEIEEPCTHETQSGGLYVDYGRDITQVDDWEEAWTLQEPPFACWKIWVPVTDFKKRPELLIAEEKVLEVSHESESSPSLQRVEAEMDVTKVVESKKEEEYLFPELEGKNNQLTEQARQCAEYTTVITDHEYLISKSRDLKVSPELFNS
ncbi:hypothetical protein G6011_07041 [Alternaria panax]|uniref:Uncharacterized protein n=1 Tax=Alternaria panax TaxID=48097 RepID=A0AAD4F9B5_9PLEO|nr:hypothetical protein G6011_07041 [Alternaria panax]